MGAVKALTADGLFIGQSPEFFAVLTSLAKAADAARHGSWATPRAAGRRTPGPRSPPAACRPADAWAAAPPPRQFVTRPGEDPVSRLRYPLASPLSRRHPAWRTPRRRLACSLLFRVPELAAHTIWPPFLGGPLRASDSRLVSEQSPAARQRERHHSSVRLRHAPYTTVPKKHLSLRPGDRTMSRQSWLGFWRRLLGVTTAGDAYADRGGAD